MSIEELKKEYDNTFQNDELIEYEPRWFEYKNEEKRKEIRRKYINLLPKNQRLAIKLHNMICNYNHIDCCSFNYEINELEDRWDEYEHRVWLEKANKLLEIEPNEEKLISIIENIKR